MANGDVSTAHWSDAYERARRLLGDAFPAIPSDISRREADRLVFRALDARTKGECGDRAAGWVINDIKLARKHERERLKIAREAGKSRTQENDAVSRLAPGVWAWIQHTFRERSCQLSCVDGFRWARITKGDRLNITRYRKVRDHGCCGFFDQRFLCPIDGHHYRVGFNYGH